MVIILKYTCRILAGFGRAIVEYLVIQVYPILVHLGARTDQNVYEMLSIALFILSIINVLN